MAGLDIALAGVVSWIGENILIDTVRVTLPATGDPVLNETTGRLEYPDGQIWYEGPGAVQGVGAQAITAIPSAVQPWIQETDSRYQLLTPLDAPIPPKDAVVTVAEVHNPARAGLLGRSWTCQDPGRAATVEVVRVTFIDQNQAGVSP